MGNISLDEIIIIKGTNKTARVIEIYVVNSEFDKLFAVRFPDGQTGFVFESVSIPLSNFNYS